MRVGAGPGPPPSKTTIWRVLSDVGADALDAAAGDWLMNLAGLTAPAAGEDGLLALTQARLDGEAIRGAEDADGKQVRLLAAMAGPDAATSVIAARAEAGRKTDEVPVAKAVLCQAGLAGKVVTADALHTVKATAGCIREHGGEFILPVKENRRALLDAVNALPWEQAPIAPAAADKGHGRITTRTIQVLPAPGRPSVPARQSGFPHRALGHRPAGQAGLRRHSSRRRQPGSRAGRPRWAGRVMDRPFSILGLT